MPTNRLTYQHIHGEREVRTTVVQNRYFYIPFAMNTPSVQHHPAECSRSAERLDSGRSMAYAALLGTTFGHPSTNSTAKRPE